MTGGVGLLDRSPGRREGKMPGNRSGCVLVASDGRERVFSRLPIGRNWDDSGAFDDGSKTPTFGWFEYIRVS